MVSSAATPNASFVNFWSSSRKSIKLWFVGLKTSHWNLCFAVATDWGFTLFLKERSQDFSQIHSIGAGDVFEGLQCITAHERVEVVYFVFSVTWLWFFKLDWNRSSNKSNFSGFPSKGGQCCCEGIWQFWDSTDVVVAIGCITVRHQLLKGQQNLICFSCRRCVLTAKLWLTCGTRLLLFSWRSTRGAVGNLFWSSCRHVRTLANFYCSSYHHVRAIASLFWTSCEDSLLPLGCLDDQSDERIISLRGRDRLRNDPQWFPGFLNCCSWMFLERLRNKSELVGLEGTRQVLVSHPRYETLSYWNLLRVF